MAANYFGAADSLLSGIGGVFSGLAASKGAKISAKFYRQAAAYTERSTAIKELMFSRELYRTLGAGRADIAASGIKLAGSAADVMRASAQEGAITRAIIAEQGLIEKTSYIAQAEAAELEARAQKKKAILSAIGAAVSVAGMFVSDDRLKTDISLVRLDPRGFGIYLYRFLGDDQFYEGVLANEVEKVMPEAVSRSPDGYAMVSYEKLGLPLVRVGVC